MVKDPKGEGGIPPRHKTTCGTADSELGCNDDFGDANNGEVQSEIIIDLEAGQELFLIVDTFATEEGAEGAAFSARAEKIIATAPVLDTAEVVFNNRNYFLAARVSGSDAESDVETIGFIFNPSTPTILLWFFYGFIS